MADTNIISNVSLDTKKAVSLSVPKGENAPVKDTTIKMVKDGKPDIAENEITLDGKQNTIDSEAVTQYKFNPNLISEGLSQGTTCFSAGKLFGTVGAVIGGILGLIVGIPKIVRGFIE